MSGTARAGTTLRGADVRTAKPDIVLCAFSRTRPGHLCLSLTEDSHGWSATEKGKTEFPVLVGEPAAETPVDCSYGLGLTDAASLD